MTQEDFTHYIDLQGRVDANNIVNVMPRGLPLQVKQVYVKGGDIVNKGQLLLRLDDALMLQGIEGLNTQLAYYKNLYARYKNLWDQGIGAEVQVIQAKNNVDAAMRSKLRQQRNHGKQHLFMLLSAALPMSWILKPEKRLRG